MVQQIGHTWARKTRPTVAVAKIHDVIKGTYGGSKTWHVYYDEVNMTRQHMDGVTFQMYYMPPKAEGPLSQLPESIANAILTFEHEIAQSLKILVVTPTHREQQLAIQSSARLKLAKVINTTIYKR